MRTERLFIEVLPTVKPNYKLISKGNFSIQDENMKIFYDPVRVYLARFRGN